MAKDLFKTGFDDGTQIKLQVVKEYFMEWLPVFIRAKKQHWDKIFIYDFFAGEGTDIDGKIGSPLILLNELKIYCHEIVNRNLYCKLVFNEINESKTKLLKNNIKSFIDNCKTSKYCPKKDDADCAFELCIENNNFKSFFSEIYSTMEQYSRLPRFMFLDQYGIKEITEDIFKNLVRLKRTDFIFFISSSFVRRFTELPEFKEYLKLSRKEFDTSKSYQCHRVIFEYYKQLVPNDIEYHLAPFSIKKGSNIYGLIFGSNHLLGIEKFLNVCWKINPNTGDANFDIDNERISPKTPKLFKEFDIPNKIQFFENMLIEKIRNGELTTIKQVYSFTLDMGCLPKHANKVLRKLQKDNVIKNDLTLISGNIHRIIDTELV